MILIEKEIKKTSFLFKIIRIKNIKEDIFDVLFSFSIGYGGFVNMFGKGFWVHFSLPRFNIKGFQTFGWTWNLIIKDYMKDINEGRFKNLF